MSEAAACICVEAKVSRIRNVKLDRFTIDRMIAILGKLGQDVEVTVSVRPRAGARAPHPA